MPLLIVNAKAESVPELVRLDGIVQILHAKLIPSMFRDDWDPDRLTSNWMERLSNSVNTIALAQSDGSAVGYIWFQTSERSEDALHPARRNIYVHQLVVEDGARRQGVGAALLAFADREAARLGIGLVMLDTWFANEGARTFFKAQEFEPINILLAKATCPA